MLHVPELRIRQANDAAIAADGRYVLYWMIAQRRTTWNFALDRAVWWARELKKPLVIFEALRVRYPWASDRLHRFVLEGMLDNHQRLEKTAATYYAYLEPKPGDGEGLLEALAADAAVVVTDEYPCFFLPRMVAAAARRLPVRLEAIDSNGLLPLRAADRAFVSAYQFRRFLQKQLRPHLGAAPAADPLKRQQLPKLAALPRAILKRWPAAPLDDRHWPRVLAELPIDHAVMPAAFRGGSAAAKKSLRHFLQHGLDRYLEDRNEPEADVTSGFSPYLHFGHLSPHEVFWGLARRESWSPDRLAAKATGRREGWWGLGAAAEAFVDQLLTWRELGFNACVYLKDYDRYESLPDWAQDTLAKHAHDRRTTTYTPDEFERAATHDSLWNAAQGQLVSEGRLHNYLRMLWGKKILEWSKSPREALAVMIELNNKYAVDGRDPNSYSGIFWCLGRYDRPWGPKRKIFGTVRYMSSENTARKVRVRQYIERYAAAAWRDEE